MSKKPYIIQENSPNLVIVPTEKIDAVYEPPPERATESEALANHLPSPSYPSVFARKTSAKLNHSGVNNNVLIDVRKVQRSSKSWAANYLQSIGGPSIKVDRIYSLAPKPTSQPDNKEINFPHTTTTHYYQQLHTNAESNPQIMKKITSQQQININLLNQSPASQCTITKETSKPNCNVHYNMSTSTSGIRKEPSLPKNYKIPTKHNKPPIVKDKETTRTNTTDSIDLQDSVTSKNRVVISSQENNDDINKQNKSKIAFPNITTNKEIHNINKYKEPNQLKRDLKQGKSRLVDNSRSKVNKNTEHIKYGNEIKHLKKNKTADHNDKYHKSQCNELIIPAKYNETTKPVHNKENNQPKHSKEIKHCKAIKETALPRNKAYCPQRNINKHTTHKTKEDIIAHIKAIKEIYKLKKKQEPTYSTKFKTRKEHISVASSKVSKIAKDSKSQDHSQDILSKKYKDKSVTNNELPPTRSTKADILAKLKKRASEKISSHGYTGSKSKKHKLSSPDTSETQYKKPKSVNEKIYTKSISPIKSVVSKIKTGYPFHNSEKVHHKELGYYQTHYEKNSSKEIDYLCQNSEKHLRKDPDPDLRTKLKRKNLKKPKTYTNKKDKFVTSDRFVPEENLIISFNAEEDSEEKLTMTKSPTKKLARKQPSPKDKKCKKIKLEINIVFGQGDTTDEESAKSEAETNAEEIENMDLSFLDDFNVDEIAESLNECKDSTRKTNETTKQETVADSYAQNSISDKSKKIDTVVNKDSALLDINGSMGNIIPCAEIKEYCQDTALHSTENEHRHGQEENHNTNVKFCTGINERVKNEIKTEVFQENTAGDSYIRASIPEVLLVNTSMNNFTNSDLNFIPIDEAHKPTCKANNDIEINDNKVYATRLGNNEDKRAHAAENLEFVTKVDHTEINTATENWKQYLVSSEIPDVKSLPESNIYSDHNDLIDALQDNNSLEINAIKSYIASINNTTNEMNKNTTKHVMSTTVSKYSIIPADSQEKYTPINSTNNLTEIVTCIKEDPDIILIDDSDTENEPEIKNYQPVKDKNVTDVQPAKKSILDKSEEITIIEPAIEHIEPIIIVDTNAEDLQPAKESRLDKYDDVAIIELADENSSESTLILETTAEDIQPFKEVRLDKSGETVIINHTCENSKSTPKLHTDCVIVESNSTQLNDSHQNANSNNIILHKAQENISIENKNNTSAELHSESENILIKNQVLNDLPVTSNTDTQNKDLPNTDQVASKTDAKTSEESPDKNTIAEDDTKVECTPKTVTVNTKTQNVDTQLDTMAQNNSKSEENYEKTEKVTNNSEHKEKVTNNSENKESVTNNSEHKEKVTNNTENKESVTNNSEHKKKVTNNTENKEKVTNNTENKEKVTKNSENKESVTNNSEHKEKVTNNTEKKEKVTNNTENKDIERNPSLANNAFVICLETQLLQFIGQKCIVSDFIRFDGRFSKIYRCKDYLNQDYAVKTLKRRSDGYNIGLQKQNMMKELQNGVPENNLNCVRYITGFVVYGLWCFLMEYFPMNLQQAFVENKRSFHIDAVQNLSRQLVSAVTVLRNNNIIHSDIKPSHILINSSQTRIKLCGFDQASYFQDIKLLPKTGTTNYRAPELILGYPAGYGIDVWSTALVMYEMATNRKLFHGYYNNHILYQQLCTLGAIPMEMLMDSQFRNTHFRGTAFTKIVGKNQRTVIYAIEFNDKLNTTLFRAYTTDWGNERQANKKEDKAKIRELSDLLHSMLAMHPKCRIAIEFVFANPFIYESFDDC